MTEQDEVKGSKIAPQRVPVSNWADMADAGGGRTAVVNVRVPPNKLLQFSLGHLSYVEWNEIGLAVENPAVPATRWNDRAQRKDPNPYDPGYLADLEMAETERMLRRLASALIKGGMSIPGDDLGEYAECLRNLDTGIINALLTWLRNAGIGVMAELDARAETFHGLRTAGVEGVRTEGLEPPPVAGA